MGKSGAERIRDHRRRQRLRGLEAINVYLEPEAKKKLQALAEEAGSYSAAIEKLLAIKDHKSTILL